MNRRLLFLGSLLALAAVSPAGVSEESVPVLPEIRQHLSDGWACVQRDPRLARDHAMAVLVGRELSIEVDLGDVPPSRRTACRAAVDDALEAWQDALGGDVVLRRCPQGEHRGIVIRFMPEVYEDGQPVAGYVNWRREAGRDLTGTVQVRTASLDGRPMAGRAMRGIVLHEMGHLLGLDDTDRDDDAMGPLTVSHPVTRPTDREASAVRALRAEAERLLRDAR